MEYNVSDIINFETIEKFKIFSLHTFFLSTLAQCFYAFLIIYCSTKQMLTFRILMLFYIFFAFLNELLFLLIKPIKLFPFNIIFPVGFLAPISSTLAALGTAMLFLLFLPVWDVPTIIMAERHFQISGVFSKSKQINLQRFFIYGGLLATMGLTFAVFINFALSSINDNEAREVLTLNVKNHEILLNFQPSLWSIKIDWNFKFLSTLIITIISFIYRLLLILWLLYENYKYKYGKNSNFSFISEQTKQQFSLMFHTSLAQVAVTSTLWIPCTTWMALILIPNNNLQTLSFISAGLTTLYPFIDVIVVIIIVKPYRKVVRDMLTLKLT